MKALNWLWENRTRSLSFVQGIVGVLAGATDIFSIGTIKWLLLASALLTYCLGQLNSWLKPAQP